MMCRFSFLLALGFVLVAAPARSQPPAADNQNPSVDFLVKALSHPEARIRQNAFDALVDRGEGSLDALVTVIAREPQFEAASAALILARMHRDRALTLPDRTRIALYDILHDPATKPWRWNITATLLVGATKNTGIAVDSLKDHLDLWIWGVNHRASIVQLPSLRALAKIGEDAKSAQHAVLALLDCPRAPLTSIVIERRIISDRFIGLESPIPTYDPLLILETLVAIKADPHLLVGPLTKLTHHFSEYVRLDAAAMLGKLDASQLAHDPRPYAANVLGHLAMVPWGDVREAAVRELGNIGEPAAGELNVLITLLRDSDERVRMQAAVSLGKLKAAAASSLPALEAALEEARLDTTEAVKAITDAITAIKTAIAEQEKAKPGAENEPDRMI